MSSFALGHLADHILLQGLKALVRQDHATTAAMLAHLAEVDARRLHARTCASMFDYCVRKLGFSEDVAAKRIHAARTAPGPVLAMLSSPASSSDVMEQSRSYAPGHVAVVEVASEVEHPQSVAAVTAQVPAPPPCERLAPLSPGRYSFESTFDGEIVDLLDRAKALLGHQLHSRNRTEVLRRVLRDWVQAAERRKFGLTEKPRAARKRPANERTIPNAIKRAVHERDGGRCAFVGDDGQRCEAQKFLEYDHITPLARGGLTTASNLRLLCGTHNRLEAERVLGAGFMQRRRERARSSTPNRPLRAAGKPGESSPFPGPRAVP